MHPILHEALHASGQRTGSLLEETARLREQLWAELRDTPRGYGEEEDVTADDDSGGDSEEDKNWCPPLSTLQMESLQRVRLPEPGIMPAGPSSARSASRPQSAFVLRLRSRLGGIAPIHCVVCCELVGLTTANGAGGSWVAVKLPCSHAFCESCILPWLARCGSCPTCRFEVATGKQVGISQTKIKPRSSEASALPPRPASAACTIRTAGREGGARLCPIRLSVQSVALPTGLGDRRSLSVGRPRSASAQRAPYTAGVRPTSATPMVRPQSSTPTLKLSVVGRPYRYS